MNEISGLSLALEITDCRAASAACRTMISENSETMRPAGPFSFIALTVNAKLDGM